MTDRTSIRTSPVPPAAVDASVAAAARVAAPNAASRPFMCLRIRPDGGEHQSVLILLASALTQSRRRRHRACSFAEWVGRELLAASRQGIGREEVLALAAASWALLILLAAVIAAGFAFESMRE